MSYDLIPLFDGKLRANRVGHFTRAGAEIDIVRPGYDAQGRRRHTWTQFIFKGVPIFEVKTRAELDEALDQFDEQYKEMPQRVQDSKKLWLRALDAARNERLRKFQDGVTGESPAPALTHDGRGEGKRYPA